MAEPDTLGWADVTGLQERCCVLCRREPDCPILAAALASHLFGEPAPVEVGKDGCAAFERL